MPVKPSLPQTSQSSGSVHLDELKAGVVVDNASGSGHLPNPNLSNQDTRKAPVVKAPVGIPVITVSNPGIKVQVPGVDVSRYPQGSMAVQHNQFAVGSYLDNPPVVTGIPEAQVVHVREAGVVFNTDIQPTVSNDVPLNTTAGSAPATVKVTPATAQIRKAPVKKLAGAKPRKAAAKTPVRHRRLVP